MITEKTLCSMADRRSQRNRKVSERLAVVDDAGRKRVSMDIGLHSPLLGGRRQL